MDFAFLYWTDQSKISRIMMSQRKRRIHFQESTSGADSSVLLTHHDPRDLGLICPSKKRKIRFQILSDLRIQSWILLKKRTLRKCLPTIKTMEIVFSITTRNILNFFKIAIGDRQYYIWIPLNENHYSSKWKQSSVIVTLFLKSHY